jgi:hypothetical protein
VRVAALLIGAVLAFATSATLAIELKPYPTEKITEAQWKDYFGQVKAAYGASMQELRDQRLVVFHDDATATSYAFTEVGHAAHPAWITRRIAQEGDKLYVDQIGYFAGNEAAFAVLFQQYQATNQKMIDAMKRKSGNTP